VPVEVDGIVHRVFVCKRPGLDVFMRRVAEQALEIFFLEFFLVYHHRRKRDIVE